MRRRISVRLFAVLLYCYPPDFRRRFGTDMREYFDDELARARRESGVSGAARLSLRTLVDTAVHAGAERRRREMTRRRPLMMEETFRNMHYAGRSMLRRPAFTLVAVGTLALGIGANAAVFSLVSGVLLRPLPYNDAADLVRVTGASREEPRRAINLSRPDFADLAREARTLAGLGAFNAAIGTFTIIDGEPERVRAVSVSAGFFRVLETAPLSGGLFTQEDDETGADAVVISHGLWQRRFGSDPAIVGRTVTLGVGPQVVIGVLPSHFRYPQPDLLGEPELYTPMSFGSRFPRSGRQIRAIGRLKPGVTVTQAQTDLVAVAARLELAYPTDNFHTGVLVEPLLDTVVGETRPGLLVLFAAVTTVLLVACVNIANLLVAHGATRRKELAIRAALGAGRWRLIGQLITENLVLTGIGGALGLLLAWGTLRATLALGASSLPRADAVGLNLDVVLYTAGVSVATGVVIGFVTASHALRKGVTGGSSEGTRGGTTASIRSRLRSSLIAAEIAASVILVIAAALLVQSLWHLSSVPLGFTRDHVLSVEVVVPASRYPDGAQIRFYEELYRRIAQLPGVLDVAGTNILPLSGGYSCDGFRVDRHHVPRGQEPCAEARSISHRFFEVMGIPLIAGRGFTTADGPTSRPVVVINQAMARQFWPGENPVGQTITLLGGGDRETSREIVGVVADTKHLTLAELPRPMFYRPQSQPPSFYSMTLLIRSETDSTALTGAVRQEVRQMDARLALYNIRTLDQLRDRAIAAPRFRSVILAVFAVMGVMLALIGLYGVIVYIVAQRTREIGIRVALGAGRRVVMQLIMRQALAPVLWGLVAGMALAVAAGRGLSTLLFGVSAFDPPTFVAIPLLILAVSLAASWMPARRATRVDPVAAIRTD